MGVVHAKKEAIGSRRCVLGPCLSLEDRQAGIPDTDMSPTAGVHINQSYVLHIGSFSMHHDPCPMWQQVPHKPCFWRS